MTMHPRTRSTLGGGEPRRRARPRKIAALWLVASLGLSCGLALASEEEVDLIVEALALEEGQRIADVGAGEGEWSEALARRVGEAGQVWATEVDDDLIEEIEERLAGAGLDNARVVRGDQSSTGLPPSCCDAVLLRMVYHHFEDPAAMIADLRAALLPGGRLVVIDIRPQDNWRDLPGTPDRGGHGIDPATLVAELEAGGFAELERHDPWDDREDRYCVVFRAPDDRRTSSP